MARVLKGLQDVIGLSVVSPVMKVLDEKNPEKRTWVFPDQEEDGAGPDTINGCKTMQELYLKAEPNYSGRYSVPVFWDKKTSKIVNNESAEILRFLNSEFNKFAKNPELDLYPEAHRAQIDKWNEEIGFGINNGVYRAGFAKEQEVYEKAFHEVFAELDKVEAHLATNRYICGKVLTEADLRLFVSIVRFDPVYYGHFKVNKKRIVDYKYLPAWLQDVYQLPGISDTVRVSHIKKGYYSGIKQINPTGVFPLGPELMDLNAPHNRNQL